MGVALLPEAAGTSLMSLIAPEQFPLPSSSSAPLLPGEVREKHRGYFEGLQFCGLALGEELLLLQPRVAATSRNPLSVTTVPCGQRAGSRATMH